MFLAAGPRRGKHEDKRLLASYPSPGHTLYSFLANDAGDVIRQGELAQTDFSDFSIALLMITHLHFSPQSVLSQNQAPGMSRSPDDQTLLEYTGVRGRSDQLIGNATDRHDSSLTLLNPKTLRYLFGDFDCKMSISVSLLIECRIYQL